MKTRCKQHSFWFGKNNNEDDHDDKDYNNNGTTMPNNAAKSCVPNLQDDGSFKSTPFINMGQSVRLTYSFVDPDTGEELDWTENRDDFVDLDAAFEASEVKAILGDFCDDAAKGDVSEALVIIGETYDGVPIYSVPADDNTGIDRLVNVNK